MPGDDTTAAVGDTNYRREGVEEEGDDKVSESVPDPSEHMNFISSLVGGGGDFNWIMIAALVRVHTTDSATISLLLSKFS